MNKYEAMFIVKPELSEEERNTLLGQIKDVLTKNGGVVSSADLWSDKRKLTFRIKKHDEGFYYLVMFTLAANALAKVKYALDLNENILRVMILNVEEK